MSTAAKILILTWVVIGFVVVGGVGFYLGRVTAPKGPDDQQQPQMPGQTQYGPGQMMPQPTMGQPGLLRQ